jgi:hypothetical protein
MEKLRWFERSFVFGLPVGMLPFYLERLEGTIVRIEQKVAKIPEEILSNQLDGKWSVKQNIGHLAEVDEIALKRIDEIRRGQEVMSPAVFEPKADYNSQRVKEVVEFFRKNRIANLDKYKTLVKQDFETTSMHPRLKMKMSVVDLALFDAEHDDHHLVRINEILNTLLINPA